MKQVNVKKLILPNIPYVFIALLSTKVSEAVRLAPGSDASTKLLNIMTGLNTAFHSLVPSFHPIDLCMGVAAAIAIRLAVYIKGKNAKKFRKNLEYGSARWGTAEDIKPYVDPAFENNIILTQTERLTMNSRPKDPKTARNKNVLIVGGSGSGKTRFWLKPNLLQCTSKTYPTSFVVTDPKGDIVVSCGHALQKNGYQIKILNSLNFKKSMHYNPFAYIHSEKDILKLVTTLIANTKGEGKAGDDFWVKAETLLYTALIGYIHYEAPMEEQNFSTLIEFINAMEVREDDEDFKNPVDLMFDELKKRKPDHFAVRQYAKFKLSAGKTAKSILISCGARLAPFDIQELRELTAYPYVWGGSSPSTSFDCSGFVSWVINHSGWDVGRLGAQGLCNICTPVSSANVKPGDLVFFTGTYDTPGVSHVGIYVGNNMMIHCGDPISYANLNSNYWQSHFYRYGRLP